MLLKDAVEAFLLALEARGCRPRTVGSYRQRLAGLMRLLGSRGLTEVTPGDLDAWVVSLRRQSERWGNHPQRPAAAGGLSEATIAGRIQAAKAFFRWCEERGLVDRSPARHLRKPRLDQAVPGEKVMDRGDLLRMVEAAGERAAEGGWLAVRDLALLLFLADTGCRVGEAASLRLGWLRLEACEADVEGKTGRRVVDYTERTAAALRAYLAVRPSVGNDRVFVGRSGDPLTPRGIYQVFKRLAKAAGVKGRFNPHSLRHLVGQTFTDRANLELARQKLGHKDVTTTARFYANQDRARLRAATRRLSLLNGIVDE